MKFVKDSFITLVGKSSLSLFSFLVLIITTRALGSEGRGIYALIVLVPLAGRDPRCFIGEKHVISPLARC